MTFKKDWWKYASAILLIYTVIAGFLMPVPRLPILNETIRNLYFHVPMWFGMMLLFFVSLNQAVQYLRTGNLNCDLRATEYINAGLTLGIAGLLTGSLWARYTWGAWWVFEDPKLNNSAVVMAEYFAFLILRSSIQDEKQRAKVSSVYNIFAAASIIPLLFILPRMSDSLHPGNGGNPGFNTYDLDSHMRMVFYPAVLAWIGMGFWIAQIMIRTKKLEIKLDDQIA